MDQRSLYLVRQAINAIFKRWRMVVGLFLVILVPVTIGTLLKKPVYQADAKIFVGKDRVYPEVSPIDRKEEAGSLPNEAMINSEMQVLRSRYLLQQLADTLDEEAEQSGDGRSTPTLAVLSQKVRVSRKPGSNVLEIAYSSPDQQLAIDVVNTLVRLHRKHHIEFNKDSSALAFFKQRAEKAKADYVDADLSLERFDATHGLTSIAVEKDAAIRQREQIEADQRRTEASIVELTTKIASLEGELEYVPKTETTGMDLVPNPVVEYMRQNLSRLQMERERLLALYTPQHRLVVDIENEIAALKKQIAGEKHTVVGRRRTIASSVRKRLEQELLAAQADLGSLEARRALVAQRLDEYDAKIRQMHTEHYEIMRMRRDRTEKRQTYDALQGKLRELSLSDQMDGQGISNLRLVEAAVGPLKAEPDFKGITIVLTFIAALLLSTGSAVVMELLNPVLNSELDVRHQLGLPVLAELPLNGLNGNGHTYANGKRAGGSNGYHNGRGNGRSNGRSNGSGNGNGLRNGKGGNGTNNPGVG